MSTICFTPVRGKRIRATRLDVCGNVPAALTADSLVATDGFVTVTLSSEVEDGSEIIQKNAFGALCVNSKAPNSFKRFTVEIEFCGVDPGLLSLVTNAETYNDYADNVAGITVAEGTVDTAFALELWTGLSGAVCASGDEEASGYLLLPFVQSGVLGDIAVAEDASVTFSMTGGYTLGGNTWGVGPYDVLFDGAVASPLPTALDPFDHLLLVQTGVAPPASACGLVAMPA